MGVEDFIVMSKYTVIYIQIEFIILSIFWMIHQLAIVA